MIISLLIIPLIGVLSLLLIKENSINVKSQMKNIALFTSLINLLISLIMWYQFDSSSSNYQFLQEFNYLTFCHFNIGIDGISIYFILLTTFITPLCILSNWSDINNKLKYFLISFLILETLQIAVFVVLDLFLFYIFFESVLIPLFFIIIIWGGSSKKYRAAFLLFLYTLGGSLFMLLAILFIYYNTGSTDFLLLSLSDINFNSQKILWLSLSFSKKDMTNRLIILSNSTLYSSVYPISSSTKMKVKVKNKEKDCKSLVNYLSPYSIGSTLKYKNFTSKLREMCNIPFHLQSIILGVLLSDGWLYKNKSNKTLFALKQTNFEYIWLVYINLSHFCRSLPIITKTSFKGKFYYSFMFATRVYPCFSEWYYMFYREGKKVLPLDLYNMLTYEALAHWIMGDGTNRFALNKGMTLQTQSFTIPECVFLINILIHKFNLKCSLHMQRSQPTIYISSKSMKKIIPLILPYMCNSMLYKIGIVYS